jgi:biotin-(acetyl-CoA carboxylase) ligase
LKTLKEDQVANEPSQAVKVALLTALRQQAALAGALADLEDVLKEAAPNEPIPNDLFVLNEKIDGILVELADQYNVDIPDSQEGETSRR